MADSVVSVASRILTWYVDTLVGDNTSMGPVYIADVDYRPRAVRVHAKRASDAGDLTFDIKDDGKSIFTSTPRLKKGRNSDDLTEDFKSSAPAIKRYSLITLDLTPQGASGITVHLELEKEQDGELKDWDT